MTRILLLALSSAVLACTPEETPTTDKVTPGEEEVPAEETPKAVTCIEPLLTVPHHTVQTEAVRVQVSRSEDLGDARRFLMRPITIDGSGEGSLTLTTDGPFALANIDGVIEGQSLTLTQDDLPATLLLATPRDGDGTLVIRSSEDCSSIEQPLQAARSAATTGRSLAEAPWFHNARLFRADEQIEVQLPTDLLRDRIGADFDVYLVQHKSLADWVADPSLEDVADEVESLTVQADHRDNVHNVWSSSIRVPRRMLVADFDVVYDFDQDGELSPGDLIDGTGTPAFTVSDDMSRAGPYSPTMVRHSGGTWRRQEVWYPAEIDTLDGPAPLVVISHGNGHDYTWYDHIAEHLASWGIVVMSHSNQTGAGIVAASRTTLDNTDYFFEVHDTLANGVLANKVDNTRIGWIGHSRGGEGVVRAYARLAQGQWTSPWYDPSALQFVSSMAPTVFLGVTGDGSSNPGEVMYHLLAGGADGDVTGGADCDVCQFFRIPAVSRGDMGITYVHGTSHNVLHNGGGFDDGIGPNRLGRNQIHPMQQSIYLSLVGWRMLGVDNLGEVFQRSADSFRPQGVPDALTISSVWRDGIAADRLVVDDFQTNDATTNTLGGAVRHDLDEAQSVLLDDNNGRFTSDGGSANGFTWVHNDGYERGLVAAWSQDASYTTTMPEGMGSVRNYEVLSMRVAQTTRHENTTTLGGPMDFVVELEDANGTVAAMSTHAFGRPYLPYQRTGLGGGAGWANEFSTIELPVAGFTAIEPLLDTRRITSVRLRFGPSVGSPVGRVGIDDIYFARRP